MNGVDVSDQLTVFYAFVRKTRKWWRKLFFWLLEVSVVNSYLLYKETVEKPKSHLDYRRAMIEHMAKLSCQLAPPRQGPGAPRRATETLQRLNHKPHFLSRSDNHRDCVVCSNRSTGHRRRTIYYCETCDNNPFLCPDICFKRYHTMANYNITY